MINSLIKFCTKVAAVSDAYPEIEGQVQVVQLIQKLRTFVIASLWYEYEKTPANINYLINQYTQLVGYFTAENCEKLKSVAGRDKVQPSSNVSHLFAYFISHSQQLAQDQVNLHAFPEELQAANLALILKSIKSLYKAHPALREFDVENSIRLFNDILEIRKVQYSCKIIAKFPSALGLLKTAKMQKSAGKQDFIANHLHTILHEFNVYQKLPRNSLFTSQSRAPFFEDILLIYKWPEEFHAPIIQAKLLLNAYFVNLIEVKNISDVEYVEAIFNLKTVKNALNSLENEENALETKLIKAVAKLIIEPYELNDILKNSNKFHAKLYKFIHAQIDECCKLGFLFEQELCDAAPAPLRNSR